MLDRLLCTGGVEFKEQFALSGFHGLELPYPNAGNSGCLYGRMEYDLFHEFVDSRVIRVKRQE
jgi:hypothetical protein